MKQQYQRRKRYQASTRQPALPRRPLRPEVPSPPARTTCVGACQTFDSQLAPWSDRVKEGPDLKPSRNAAAMCAIGDSFAYLNRTIRDFRRPVVLVLSDAEYRRANAERPDTSGHSRAKVSCCYGLTRDTARGLRVVAGTRITAL